MSKNRIAGIGILNTELDAGNLNDIQLLPDGMFRARDGRPKDLTGWRMNAANAARIIAACAARKTPLVVDYEHQSLRAEKNGQPAPAAGWIQPGDLSYKPGKGLYAKVSWTERAKQWIAAREYKFISPVMRYDEKTGDVVGLLMAAITNTPAVDGMDEVLARAAASFVFTDNEDPTVNWKEKLLALLGLKTDAEDTAVLAALEGVIGEAKEAKTAKAELTSVKTKLATAQGEIAALKEGGAEEPDPEKYVPVAVVKDLQTQLADLSGRINTSELEDVIQAALNDERGPLLLESQLDWARKLGGKDLEALKAYLKTAKPIAALRAGGGQTRGRKPPEGDAAALTDEGREILEGLGLDAGQIKSIQEGK